MYFDKSNCSIFNNVKKITQEYLYMNSDYLQLIHPTDSIAYFPIKINVNKHNKNNFEFIYI